MNRTEENRRGRLVCAVLMAVTFALYCPILGDNFVNFDDGTYVTENSMVQNGLTGSSLSWAFTSGYASNWHPLTWISHMLDCDLFGLKPAGHHFTSLLLHVLNVGLLFQVLLCMTGATWRSAIVAALFAWHPMHVESVAWVSERKDVLSTFFWLLTMLAYARYAQKFKVQGSRFKVYYCLSLVSFALGLMAKPMLVSVPFVLLLLDYWPLGRIYDLRFTIYEGSKGGTSPVRSSPAGQQTLAASGIPAVSWRWALLEKVPYFLLAAASSVVTFLVQKSGGAVASLRSLSFGERSANAVISYVRYLGKMVWPSDLAIYYPMHASWAAWQWAGAGLLIVALSVLAIALVRRRPYVAVGWFWYLGTLVPVIGLVQVGGQSMADRYTYMPFVGMFIVVVWGVTDLLGRGTLQKPNAAWAVVVIVLIDCVTLTWSQINYWRDSAALFRHAIAVTSNNSLAHVNLGSALDQEGRTEEAKAEFLIGLKMDTNFAPALGGLGTLYLHEGDTAKALAYFDSALTKQPYYADAHYNLANLLARQGKLAEAAEHYAQALNYNPNAPDAQNNLGAVLVRLDRPKEAVEHLEAAIRIKANFPEAQEQLGTAYAKLQQPDLAQAHYAEAVRLKPDFAHAHLKLGLIEASQGQLGKAIAQFVETIKLEPTNAVAFFNLGAAYQANDQLDAALDQFSAAARLDPMDAEAQARIAGVLARQGKFDEAIKHYSQAILIQPEEAKLHGQLAAVLATHGDFRNAVEHYWTSIRLKPDWPDPMRDLAWIMATNPKAELRNGPEALHLAQRACDLVGHPDPRFLSSLEVAYAEVGRFDDAIKTAEQIQQLAKTPTQKRFVVGLTNRLALYRAGKPFHQ
jgi:tetratricopeptide (TPR) repeat protein